MISKIEMTLSVVPYERKNILVYEKNFKFTKNNICSNVFFLNKIFPYYRFLPIFKKCSDFHKSWLFSEIENILHNSTLSNFEKE